MSNAFIPPTALKMLRSEGDVKEKFALQIRAVMRAGEQGELAAWFLLPVSAYLILGKSLYMTKVGIGWNNDCWFRVLT